MKRRITTALSRLLRQGTLPEKLAMSIAIGVGLGIFPLLGLTTLLCTLAAITFRLDLRVVQTVNYLVYALQILFILPLLRVGEKMFNAKTLSLYPPQLTSMLHQNMFATLRALGHAVEHAVAAWMLIGPISIAVIYFAVIPHLLSLANQPAPPPAKARAAAGGR